MRRERSRNLPNFRRWGSPVIMYLDSETKAQDIIQLSSGSSLIIGDIFILGKISDICMIPVISSSREVLHSFIRRLNLCLCRTPNSSSKMNLFKQRVNRLFSISLRILLGNPFQSKADMRTLVSETILIKIFFFLYDNDGPLLQFLSEKVFCFFPGMGLKKDEG